jgi:hypothetical protein
MLSPIAQPVEIGMPGKPLAGWMVTFCDWRVGEVTVIPEVVVILKWFLGFCQSFRIAETAVVFLQEFL